MAARQHLPETSLPARLGHARALVEACTLAHRVGGERVLEPHGIDLAVLGNLERRVETTRGVRRHDRSHRQLAHGEAVVAQLRQRRAQVLGLLRRARQPQAAVLAVLAIEPEGLHQVPHALVAAPAHLQQGAGAFAPPQGDALGIGLGGCGEQESRVATAGRAGEAAGFEQSHGGALLGQRPCERDAGDATTHDENVGVEVGVERGKRGGSFAHHSGVSRFGSGLMPPFCAAAPAPASAGVGVDTSRGVRL